LQHASLDDGGSEVATTTRAHAQAQAHAHTQDIVEHHSDAKTLPTRLQVVCTGLR